MRKLFPATFEVKIAPDKILKRHVDQMVRITDSDNIVGETKHPVSEPTKTVQRSKWLGAQ